MSVAIRPFLPSVHGCAFGNGATHRLPITVGPRRLARVTGGLCGGMVLDSLRAWTNGAAPATTSDMSRVFAAQLRSFQIPSAPARYLRLQRPGAARARALSTERTRQRVVPMLRRGEPIPLALVSALSRSPLALVEHHIVLAYRVIQDTPAATVLAIYDPNYPRDDHVTLRLSAGENSHSGGRAVHAVFPLRAR